MKPALCQLSAARWVPLAALLALTTATPDLDAQRRKRREGRAPELVHGSFTTASFQSEALGKEVDYGVYLPAGYGDPANAERTYPLVIWLHGMWEDHRRFHLRGGTATLDRLIGAGAVPECVLVTANGGRASFYINGVAGAYEDLITEDLLEHVRETYRVDPDPQRCALMGVSMGGNGALRIALRYPDRFGVVAAHSAAVLPREIDQLDEQFPWIARRGGGRRLIAPVFGDPVDIEHWRRENLLAIADRIDPDSIAGLKIYFDVGSDDPYGFAATNRELHEVLKARGVPHTFRLVEGGGHGWDYTPGQLPHSLGFVAAAWAAERGAAGLAEVPVGSGPPGERSSGGTAGKSPPVR